GQFEAAERLYRQSLAIKQKLFGPSHPDLAMTINNLAVISKAQGKFAEAESLYQQALAIFAAALGPDQPKVGVCVGNYAGLLREPGGDGEERALEGAAGNARASRMRRTAGGRKAN